MARTIDPTIFQRARLANAIIMSKDEDFVTLVEQHGPPPHILWLTCGNTSNTRLRHILAVTLPEALRKVAAGEAVVEIRDSGA